MILYIDQWSDYACPYCYIGKMQLARAAQTLPLGTTIKVRHHAYLLDPDKTSSDTQPFLSAMAAKTGESMERLRKLFANITDLAKDVGLTYQMEKIIDAPTTDAHRLTYFAATKGCDEAVNTLLYDAYFCQGRDLGDHETLIQIGQAAGLDGTEIQQMLASDAYYQHIHNDLQLAEEKEIDLVPHFVLSEAYELKGVQPDQRYAAFLAKALDEKNN